MSEVAEVATRPVLDEGWVKQIFAELRNTYGLAFDRQWECPPDVEPLEHARGIRRHWARELGTLSGLQLRFALDNLPAHPPNLIEFRATAMRKPAQQQRQLLAHEQPKADPERLAAIFEGYRRTVAARPGRAWAKHLLDADQAPCGKPLTPAQRRMAKDALQGRGFGSDE